MAYTRFPAAKDAAMPPPEAIPPADQDPEARPARQRRSTRAGRAAASGWPHWLLMLFILAVLNPLTFNIGSLALSPSRVMIVLCAIPVLIMFLSGKAGKWLIQDILMFLFAIWAMLALLVYGGFGMIELIGISALEIMVPYLLARCLIRTETDYENVLKFMLVMISILAVAAMIEATTTRQLINKLFEPFGHTYPPPPSNYEKRLGMTRAQAVFQHPILFGVSMSIFFAPLWLSTLRDGRIASWRRGSIALLATFFSLSTGAWLGMVVQCMLMGWNTILRTIKARWKILITLTIIAYVAVDLLSNRTPFDVFISYATLNSGTGYWRKLIFIYGMENVWQHPVFGLGLGDWARPSWMFSSSVDNYWLATAMRYGIPAFLLFAGTYAAIILTLARASLTSERTQRHRNALVYAMIGAALSFCTVYIWGTAMYFLWFFLGMHSWILAEAPESQQNAASPGRRRTGRRTGAKGPAPSRPQSAGVMARRARDGAGHRRAKP